MYRRNALGRPPALPFSHRGMSRAGAGESVVTHPLNDQAGDVPPPVDGVLLDLLMGVMNSLDTWSAAAGDRGLGLRWRDAVTTMMAATDSYRPYEGLVTEGAAEIGLPAKAPSVLFDRWTAMQPWPDVAVLHDIRLPYAFVTNSSTRLAEIAAGRSGLAPRFTLSAEEAGHYKPDPRVYAEACRRLGSDPARTLFVAGSPYDADGARAAGLVTCRVRRRPEHPAAKDAVTSFDSLHEVVAAFGLQAP